MSRNRSNPLLGVVCGVFFGIVFTEGYLHFTDTCHLHPDLNESIERLFNKE